MQADSRRGLRRDANGAADRRDPAARAPARRQLPRRRRIRLSMAARGRPSIAARVAVEAGRVL